MTHAAISKQTLPDTYLHMETMPILSSEDLALLKSKPHVPQNSLTVGYAAMAFGAAFQASGLTLYHVAEKSHGLLPSNALFISSCMFVTVCSILLILRSSSPIIIPSLNDMGVLLCRGCGAALMIYFVNLSSSLIPIGYTVTVMSTLPIITTVLAAIVFRHAISTSNIFVLVLNIIGVLLVAHPSPDTIGQEEILGIVTALVGTFSSSVGFIFVKFIDEQLPFVYSVLAIGVCGLTISLSLNLGNVLETTSNMTALTLGLCASVCSVSAQFCLDFGLRLCHPGPASIITSINVPISFVLGVIFLGETPSLVTVVGVFLVLSSALFGGLQFLIID